MVLESKVRVWRSLARDQSYQRDREERCNGGMWPVRQEEATRLRGSAVTGAALHVLLNARHV